MQVTSLTLPCFAKINFGLRVFGKRADGYHEIDTVLQTVSLYDVLTLAPLEDPHVIVSCDDRTLAGTNNLVYSAALRLQQLAPGKGAHIRLHKCIPAQAGLGGGSSDAAVALMALSYLWGIDPAAKRLSDVAAEIGADVPFFFLGGAARATGTGTTLQALNDTAPKYLLIIKPGANVVTSDAYTALNSDSLTTSDSKIILATSQTDPIPDSLNPDALKNDFERVVFQLQPEIERAREALRKTGATHAHLTGSGSAVFGIFENKQAQERAIQAIELETGWRVFPCITVGRSHYRSAMGPVGALFARFSG